MSSLIGPVFGIASAVVLMASGPSYFLSTIRGQMKPQRATWFIWSLLAITALVSQLILGARWSVLFLAVDALGNVAMFILSLKFGVGGWGKLDKLAVGIAVIGIVSSLIIDQPLVALVGVIGANAAGAALTIRKAYLEPASESAIAWSLVGVSAIFGLISVGRVDIQLWLYPAYLIVENFAIVAGQKLGQQHQTKANRAGADGRG